MLAHQSPLLCPVPRKGRAPQQPRAPHLVLLVPPPGDTKAVVPVGHGLNGGYMGEHALRAMGGGGGERGFGASALRSQWSEQEEAQIATSPRPTHPCAPRRRQGHNNPSCAVAKGAQSVNTLSPPLAGQSAHRARP